MRNCAVYLRVSTEDQARKFTPIASQLTKIQEWARKNDAKILKDWIIADEGISGSTDNRPGFQKLMKATENGCPFDTILVYDRDRFFRNFEEQIYYEVVLRKRNIQLISITENDDPPLVKYIKGIVAEETRNQIIKHTIRGMEERAKRGLRNGGAPPYGLKQIVIDSPNGKIITLNPGDSNEIEVVKNIFKWFLEGRGCWSIANELNKTGIPSPSATGKHGGRPTAKFGWSKSTIRNILRNRAYVGDLIWNKQNRKKGGIQNPQEKWIIKENAFEGIIDRNTFNQVQEIIERNKRYQKEMSGRKPTKKYLLSGVMYCTKCLHHYIGYSYGRDNNRGYYYCAGYKTKGKYFCDWCPIDKEWFENKVFSEVYYRLTNSQYIDEIVNEFNQKLSRSISQIPNQIHLVEQEIAKIDQKLRKKLTLIEEIPKVPQTIIDEMLTLEEKKKILEMEKQSLKKQLPKKEKVSKEEIKEMLVDLEGLIDRNASPDKKRKLVADFIPRIDIYPHQKAVVHISLQPSEKFFQLVMPGGGFEPPL